MLILNGKKFARTEAEFVASLFEPGGTCVGPSLPLPLDCELETETVK